MNYRYLLFAIMATGVGGLSLPSAAACEVRLLIKNKSPMTIVAVGYRNAGLHTWSDNLIPSFVAPNDAKMVAWQGDGDYEISIRFTDAQTPTVVPVQNVCTKSQVIANPNGIAVQ